MTTASVVFSTITGNTEAIADIIIDHLRNAKIVVKKTEISQTEVSDILASDIIVIAPYTYDLGGLPEEGLDFYEDILDYNFSGKIVGVAGSGEEFYGDDFGKAVLLFEKQLRQAGAVISNPGVIIDLFPNTEEDLKRIKLLAQALISKEGETNG